MIGRGYLRTRPIAEDEAGEPGGFDAYELRLGDLMRGERATMGKSLIDVQRELKIKAAYIAAIENADPTAFDTPGFIAGYVRSYARYLNMDPDWAFETFCRESGFSTAHGMSPGASGLRPREERGPAHGLGKDIFAGRPAAFLPPEPGIFSNVEPRAVGSVLVLAALLVGLGYGGWLVLREVQKVTFAPVEQPPTVVAEIDPLAGGVRPRGEGEEAVAALLAAPSTEALDRLYRPEALEVPVLVPRDGPIVALDPGRTGPLAPRAPALAGGARPDGATLLAQQAAAADEDLPVDGALAAAAADTATVQGVEDALAQALNLDGTGEPSAVVQVTADAPPPVQLVAIREAWVRVRSPDGAVLFEGILQPGQTYDVPAFAEPPTLRIGESGAVFMALGGVPYGPVGPDGAVSNNVPLSAEAIMANYQPADPARSQILADYVAVASAAQAAGQSPPTTAEGTSLE